MRTTNGPLTYSDGMQCPVVDEADGVVKVWDDARPDEVATFSSDAWTKFIGGEHQRIHG